MFRGQFNETVNIAFIEILLNEKVGWKSYAYKKIVHLENLKLRLVFRRND